MYVTSEDKTARWYWLDGKMHEIGIENEGSEVNMKELHDTCTKVIEEKEDTCKGIYFLGVALTGTGEGGLGFLMGWLARSVKNDQNWDITHIEEDVPKEEIIEHLASIMEKNAAQLREYKDDSSLKSVTPTLGSNDGTDLFK